MTKEKSLVDMIDSLDRFPGTLEEYERFKDGKYKIMDTGKPEKYVNETQGDLLSHLVEDGCVALIHYFVNINSGHNYGVPVKRIS